MTSSPYSAPRTALIYGLHNGDGVIRYVGQTRGLLSRRLNQHARQVNFNTPVSKWVRNDVGKENLQAVELDWVLVEHLNDAERWWVNHYRPNNLLNSMLMLDPVGEGLEMAEPIVHVDMSADQKKVCLLRHVSERPAVSIETKKRNGEVGAYNMHIRWHVNRSQIAPSCGFCQGTRENAY